MKHKIDIIYKNKSLKKTGKILMIIGGIALLLLIVVNFPVKEMPGELKAFYYQEMVPIIFLKVIFGGVVIGALGMMIFIVDFSKKGVTDIGEDEITIFSKDSSLKIKQSEIEKIIFIEKRYSCKLEIKLKDKNIHRLKFPENRKAKAKLTGDLIKFSSDKIEIDTGVFESIEGI